MNPIKRAFIAGRIAANRAWLAGRQAWRNGGVRNRYEGGRRWQFGDRDFIWSYVTDARFDADQATRYELVRKARYFEANNGLVQRLCDIWEQYTVGANGLSISSDSSDEAWNELADQWLEQWGFYPDLTSLQNWATLQGLISRTWFVDGEVFILKTRGDKPPYRPRLQLIEGHRVGTPYNMTSAEGTNVVDGVQIDSRGRPTAYWVQTGLQADNFTPIPAENVIHIFEPSRIGMYRGLTHFYSVMNQLHDLDMLERFEMTAAKDASIITNVIKTPSGEPLDDASEFNQVPTLPASSNDSTDPLQTPSPGGVIENSNLEYYRRMFGAGTLALKTGDDISQFRSDRPTVAQQWFWQYLGEKICLGSAGIPLILVYPDKAQGTVYRGALCMAADTFKSRSQLLASKFRDVRNYVIDTATRVDRGLANRPLDWDSVTSRPPRSVNVDIGRNSAAALAELAAGTKTWRSWYEEGGEDWKAELRQRAKEAAYIKSLATEFGVEPAEISDVAMSVPPAQPEKPGQQGEKQNA